MNPSLPRTALALLCPALAAAQVALNAGKGTFASFPPPEAGTAVDSFQRLSRLDVLPTETRPIPTNDWWTQVLVAPFAGDLWSHPLVTAPTAAGVKFWAPRDPADNGDGMKRGDAVVVGGASFAPTRDLAADWGDWHVVVRLEDGTRHLDMTLVRGVPTAWFECTGFQPTITLPAGATVKDTSGNTPTAGAVVDRLEIQAGAAPMGLQMPAGTKATLSGQILSITLPGAAKWISLTALRTSTELSSSRPWATWIPRSTRLEWTRRASGKMAATWALQGEDLSGDGGTGTMQTFPPHAWRGASEAPTAQGTTWRCPRGLLKGSVGNRFTFAWDLPGLVPDYGRADADLAGGSIQWSKSVQDGLVEAYLAKTGTYGDDTYWGGKDLVLLAKHALFARQTNHPKADQLLAKARNALADWLTWTPGEKAHYFTRYPRWKALIGFASSYGSEQFTDNHFHYGYLIHAAALVGMLDKQFLSDYGPALREVARQYAAWDHGDTAYPFLRTFEPWTGHSYAGGTSSPTGNNQESTSEAVQSWVGLELLGAALGDTAMRDAGAFGRLMETKATLEYWFDWKHENFAPGWKKSMAGIVFDGGQVYGTWFSGNPLHIHGIQYLPICPGFEHLARDTAWARGEYAAMAGEAAAAEGYTDASEYGDDWANVALSFRSLFDPDAVCRKYDADRQAGKGWTTEINAGVTYAYAHANRQLGAPTDDLAYGMPQARGFRSRTDGSLTHVIWNPSDREVECPVYLRGTLLGKARIPARSLVRHRLDAKPVGLEIVAPSRTLPVGTATRLSLRGLDQYGATLDAGTATWSTTDGSISADGTFQCPAARDSVRITAKVGALQATITVRVGEAPRLARLRLHPAYLQTLVGQKSSIQFRAEDQYGDPVEGANIAWKSTGPLRMASGSSEVEALATGTGWVVASVGGLSDSIPVDVYAFALALSNGAHCTALTENGANTAAKACDNDGKTRWESVHGVDPQWLQLDLDTLRELRSVTLSWENARAKAYRVLVSTDSKTWKTWAEAQNGSGTLDSLAGSGVARHVRIEGLERNTAYGYSLWEVRLWGFPRTAWSTRLDQDTLSWKDAGIARQPRTPFARARLEGSPWSVELLPGEQILSWSVVGADGRLRATRSIERGVVLVRIQTNQRRWVERMVAP